jgi:hypothetical protein
MVGFVTVSESLFELEQTQAQAVARSVGRQPLPSPPSLERRPHDSESLSSFIQVAVIR